MTQLKWTASKVIVVSIIIPLLYSCSDSAPIETEEIARPVKTFVVSGSNGISLEYPGEVQAEKDSTLAFEVAGKITSIPVLEGQKVKSGDVLAQLDTRDYESTYKAAKGVYTEAEANLGRAKELIKDNFISRADLEKLQSSATTASSNLEKAKKALDDTSLRAPFDGSISKKLVENFENVQPKQPIILLQSVDELKVEINIPESDWARAKKDRNLEQASIDLQPKIKLASVAGKSFPAKFRSVSTMANATTRTYTVTLSFESPSDTVVLPGMTATVILTPKVDLNTKDMAVPANAVVADDDTPYVWVIDTNTMTVSKRHVEIGTLSGGFITILSGLSANEHIASSGAHQLHDGTKVRNFE